MGDKIILDVHQSIDASFTTAFETKLVEATTASWMFWFGMLRDFVQAEGHCNVHLHYKTTEGYRLGGWLSNQRKYYKTGQLSDDRIRPLEAMGIVWDAPAAKWEQGFAALKTYKNAEGHCDVHNHYKTAKGFALGSWLNSQRNEYKNHLLPDDRITQLEALGVVWDPTATKWEQGFSALKTYKDDQGHCDVHRTHRTADGCGLGQWLSRQRNFYKKGKLPEDRITRLETLAIVWDPIEAQWEEGFSVLKNYQRTEGHCDVPWKYKTLKGYRLGEWLGRQRRYYKNDKLFDDKVKQLKKLGALG